MFCSQCGTDLPDNSQFCRKCGIALRVAPAPDAAGAAHMTSTKAARKNSVALWYLVPLLALVTLWAGWNIGLHKLTPTDSAGTQYYPSNGGNSRPEVPPPPPPPPPKPRRVTIGNGALTIPAANFTYYRLPVPPGASNVKMEGRFVATGGTGNDVEIYLFGEDEFTNWQNGHATATFYNSGRATVGDLNVILPGGAKTYYLVFNNRFSLLTPKAVQLDAALTYYQ